MWFRLPVAEGAEECRRLVDALDDDDEQELQA
jgi:hypothetical protein